MIPDPGFQKPTPYFALADAKKLYTSLLMSWNQEIKGLYFNEKQYSLTKDLSQVYKNIQKFFFTLLC